MLTKFGKNLSMLTPTSRPQAAPVSSDGMKMPLGTDRPYVHSVRM